MLLFLRMLNIVTYTHLHRIMQLALIIIIVVVIIITGSNIVIDTSFSSLIASTHPPSGFCKSQRR